LISRRWGRTDILAAVGQQIHRKRIQKIGSTPFLTSGIHARIGCHWRCEAAGSAGAGSSLLPAATRPRKMSETGRIPDTLPSRYRFIDRESPGAVNRQRPVSHAGNGMQCIRHSGTNRHRRKFTDAGRWFGRRHNVHINIRHLADA
jgi:hypothetical protein